MGAMDIDFRKKVDPWCKDTPPALTCDGTHIGVCVRHMTLDSPVTSSDRNNEIVTPAHRRLVYYFLT